MKFNWRTLPAFAHDATACAAAWLCVYWLRFTPEPIPEHYAQQALATLTVVVPAYAVLFWGFGLYRGMWRFASIPDLRRILMAVATGAILVPALMFMLQIAVPRTVLILTPILILLAVGGSRLAYRAWKERRLSALIPAKREPVLVLGAEDAAVNLIKELARSPQWRVVGVLDDDEAKIGLELHGVNVLGRFDEIPRWKRRLGVVQAIIAMPEATHIARRRVLEFCNDAGLRVLTVPSYDDLVSGRVTVSQVRHVELDDLLGRDPVQLDTAGLRDWLAGRVVMVTGAGGSIGSELARQIARFEPRQLVMFEQNELALYTIEQEFASSQPGVPAAYAIGDVKDAARVEHVIHTHNPSVIFHAAAYKHVPLMERENAWQALLNNVAGTHVIARAAAAAGVEKFVFVSSDKAVNPTSVMGASKRLGEMVCQALQRPQGTRFVMLRFGNVLGSTGSVIPRFREQIAQGGPITVTHPDITRYFMSIPEAAQLVLQAGLMGRGGEIFALDMGEPVRIVDLARDMIRLSGLTEDDIKIVFTGLRPGEKLFEEVLADGERTLPTPHPKVRIARARSVDDGWLDALMGWLQKAASPEDREVRSALARWVPEYGSGQITRESVSRTVASE